MTTTNGSSTTATVETLTAEVRVLMVGNRQITLSVAKQLDVVTPLDHVTNAITPFGRVRTGAKVTRWSKWACDKLDTFTPFLEVIGRSNRDRDLGALIVFRVEEYGDIHDLDAEEMEIIRDWMQLPLIVLAGLR